MFEALTLAQCPCSGGEEGVGSLLLFGLVACAAWLVYGIAKKDGVSRMSKVWKIAIVVGLIAVVAIVVLSKQNWSSPAADKTKPAADAVEPPQTVASLPRLVDLGSVSCIPCKMMAPILEELKKEYAGRLQVDFIDVWKNPEAGTPYGIRLIPTQVFLAPDGKELWRHEGFISKEEILAKWKELGVDLSTRWATPSDNQGPHDEGN